MSGDYVNGVIVEVPCASRGCQVTCQAVADVSATIGYGGGIEIAFQIIDRTLPAGWRAPTPEELRSYVRGYLCPQHRDDRPGY